MSAASRNLFICGALPSLLLGACASLPSDDVAVFTVIERRWVEAGEAHDTRVLEEILADGFVDATFRGGLRTRADVLNGPRAAPAYRSLRLEELTVRRVGADAAVVRGVNVLRGSAAGDVVRIRFTDVFVDEAGRWRAVAAQETLIAEPGAAAHGADSARE